jgi:hypothetical protein
VWGCGEERRVRAKETADQRNFRSTSGELRSDGRHSQILMTIQKLIDRGVSTSSISALTFQLDRSEASDCKLVRRISI